MLLVVYNVVNTKVFKEEYRYTALILEKERHKITTYILLVAYCFENTKVYEKEYWCSDTPPARIEHNAGSRRKIG